MKLSATNALLLDIDFGTGGCKITVIDTKGTVKAEASREYPMHHSKPFYSEQNPEDWMISLVACLKQISERGNIKPDELMINPFCTMKILNPNLLIGVYMKLWRVNNLQS